MPSDCSIRSSTTQAVKMVGVEAGGEGIKPEQHAARFQGGSLGVLQGTRSYILQDDYGQIQLTHSVSAGLDYAAVGPEHAWLRDQKRVEYTYATDDKALEAFMKLARLEGIIPALESAHAVAEVHRARAEDGQGRAHHREPLRPRRQRRGASGQKSEALKARRHRSSHGPIHPILTNNLLVQSFASHSGDAPEIRNGSVRSEQRSLAEKELPPGGFAPSSRLATGQIGRNERDRIYEMDHLGEPAASTSFGLSAESGKAHWF